MKTLNNSESVVEAEIILHHQKNYGGRLFRNNTGACTDINGRLIRYGLCNKSKLQNKKLKSSDEIGITPILIEPHHVGKTFGVFTAFEVKHEGWKYSGTEREEAQSNFLKLVAAQGGISSFVNGVNDVDQAVRSFKE